MKAYFARSFRTAIAAAATLTGKRFSLLVASSLVATAAIVSAAATSGAESSPLAALLGRSLAADRAPVAEAAPEAEVAAESASGEALPAPEPEPVEEATFESAAETPLEPAPEPEPEEPVVPTTPETPAPEAGRVKHVFVVSLASPGYDPAFGSSSAMPYLSATLRPQGDLLTNYSLLGEAGLANSLALVGGQAPTAETKANCPDYGKCVLPAETLSLPDQLGLAKFTWRAYMEGMVNPTTGQPDDCVYPQPGETAAPPTGGYSPQLNPFVYFHSLLDLGECSANDVPLTGLEKDLLKEEKTANFTYVSPDLCNVGVPGQCPAGGPDGAAAADAFLAQWVPKILASPAYKKDGLLIVTFGQLAPAPETAPATDPLKVGTLLVSPFVAPNSTDAVAYDPLALTRTIDELFGLAPLEKAGGKKVKTLAPALLGTNGGD